MIIAHCTIIGCVRFGLPTWLLPPYQTPILISHFLSLSSPYLPNSFSLPLSFPPSLYCSLCPSITPSLPPSPTLTPCSPLCLSPSSSPVLLQIFRSQESFTYLFHWWWRIATGQILKGQKFVQQCPLKEWENVGEIVSLSILLQIRDTYASKTASKLCPYCLKSALRALSTPKFPGAGSLGLPCRKGHPCPTYPWRFALHLSVTKVLRGCPAGSYPKLALTAH